MLYREYIQLLRGLFKSSLTDGMIEVQGSRVWGHREIAELIMASDKLLLDTLTMNAELVAEGIERIKRHECVIEKYCK